MPYIEVKVSKAASRKQEQLISAHLGIAMEEILGKNPKGLMICVKSGEHIYLGGEFMEYAAFVDVVTAHKVPEEKCALMNATILELMEQDFKVPKENTYVNFNSPDTFGTKNGLL